MVLKKSKFGGNTGNTLRHHYIKGNCQLSKTAAFIKKEHKNIETDSLFEHKKTAPNWIDDGNLNVKGFTKKRRWPTQLSLNKDRRWMLPDHLKSEVENEANYVATNPPQGKQRKVEKNRIIFMEQSGEWMLHEGRGRYKYISDSTCLKNNQESNNWRTSLNIPRQALSEADITYTVQTPIKSNVFPYHFSGESKNRVKSTNTEHRKCSFSKMYKDDYLKFVNEDDIFNEEIDEAFDPDELCEDDSALLECRKSFSLDMFMIKCKSKQKNKKIKTVCSDQERNLEKSYIVVDRPEVIFIDNKQKKPEVIRDTVLKTENCIPSSFIEKNKFTCQLENEQLDVTNLLSSFGDLYVEGTCFPRKFVLFNKDSYQQAVLVEVLLEQNFIDTTSVSVTIINGASFVKENDDKQFTLNTIVSSVFKNDLGVSEKETKEKWTKSVIRTKFIPTATSKSIESVWKTVIKKEIQIYQFEVESFQFVCSICLTSNASTCLKACQHFFCDECWKEFLTRKILASKFNILCPEFKCGTNVDVVTIMAFVDTNCFNMYNKKTCEIYVQKSDDMKFCPTPNCNNLATSKLNLSSNKLIANNAVVSCDCHQMWCFNCQHPDHWPSPCQAYASYIQQKEKDIGVVCDGSGQVFQTGFMVKRCPFCSNPINKNGGCNRMTCSCGKSFCWVCLHVFGSSAQHQCSNYVQEYEITFNSMEDLGGSRTVRLQRTAFSFSVMAKDILVLRQKLKIGKAINYLEYSVPGHDSRLMAANRAIELLHDCFKLMENMMICRAFSTSKYLNTRVVKFMDGLDFLLKTLRDELNVKQLSSMKVGVVLQSINSVEVYLRKLSLFGLSKY